MVRRAHQSAAAAAAAERKCVRCQCVGRRHGQRHCKCAPCKTGCIYDPALLPVERSNAAHEATVRAIVLRLQNRKAEPSRPGRLPASLHVQSRKGHRPGPQCRAPTTPSLHPSHPESAPDPRDRAGPGPRHPTVDAQNDQPRDYSYLRGLQTAEPTHSGTDPARRPDLGTQPPRGDQQHGTTHRRSTVTQISGLCKASPRLTRLDASGNKLRATDVDRLAVVVIDHTRLQWLDITGNRASVETVASLQTRGS